MHLYLLVLAFLQAVAPPLASGTPSLVVLFIPIIIGAVSMLVYQFVKKQSAWLDAVAPAWLHPILATILASLLTAVAAAFGVTISTTNMGALTPADITTLLGGFAALISHSIWTSTSAGSGGTSTLAGKVAPAVLSKTAP